MDYPAAPRGTSRWLCERHGVRIMSVFGSAARGEPQPRDLDGAVFVEESGDVLALLEGLVTLTRFEPVDVMDLRRAGPAARERALVGAPCR